MNGQPGDLTPDRLLELERFAEIGRLSASLLHEISNPLTAAILWLEQSDNRATSNIRHVRRSIRVLQRYVEAARQQIKRESNCRNFSIQAEVEQVKRVLVPIARSKGVRLRFASGTGYKLYGDPVKFQQIVANLVSNAIDSYSSGPKYGDKVVHLEFSDRSGYLVMEVRDQGCGIKDSQLSQLFEPFYSTKSDSGSGLGIGLFAVKNHIETDFQGHIQVKSSGKGTQFIVELPLFKTGCAQ